MGRSGPPGPFRPITQSKVKCSRRLASELDNMTMNREMVATLTNA